MHALLKGRGRSRRAIYAALAALILALAGGAYTAGGASLLHTSAAGPQWRADGLAGETVHSLALGRRGTPLIFASTETGVYRRAGTGPWTHVLNRPGVWSIQLLPDERTVVAGDGTGAVDISADGGAHWRVRRVTGNAIYVVTAAPGAPRILIAGAGGGLYRSADGGARWQRVLSRRQSAGAALAWRPGSRDVLFAGMVAGGPAGATGVYVSRDAGRTWQMYGRDLRSGAGIMSLAVAGRSRLYAGTMGRAVWAAAGAGATWSRLARGLPRGEDHVAALTTLTPASSLVAGTLGFGVYRSESGGKSWESMSAGLTGSEDAMTVLSLAYAPREHVVYAGTAAGVFTIALRNPDNVRESAGGAG